MRKVLLFVSLALSLAACVAPVAPTVAPKSTAISSPSKTAARTRKPTRSPTPTVLFTLLSSTPTPTFLPAAPSSTPTPTVLLALPSSTPAPTALSELDCRLVWQSPRNGIAYLPEHKFSVGWMIQNVGTATWDAGSAEFTYLGGAKLHNDDLVPLQSSVAPGQTIVLSVPMKAPRNSTKYTTYWGLRRGDTFFCRLKLTIYVK
ncbi:MAG: NBR1-Ig-like domain-containing protein [Anaerolineales bacterium]